MRTFKTSHCPDESFFQTVVANHIGIKRIGRSVTYADWNCRNPPAILDANHINKVTTRGFELSDYFGIGPCLFIRKFPSFRDDLRRIADSYAENRTVIT